MQVLSARMGADAQSAINRLMMNIEKVNIPGLGVCSHWFADIRSIPRYGPKAGDSERECHQSLISTSN